MKLPSLLSFTSVLALSAAAPNPNQPDGHGHGHGHNKDFSTQAGAHIIYSYPGLNPPPHLYDLIRDGKVGGIILFGENVDFDHDAVSHIAKTVDTFQEAYTHSPGYDGLPLLITTDQEGGIVRRLPGGPFKSAKQVGASPDPVAAATKAGKAAADALLDAHCNTNLAPVLGVYRDAGDFLDEYGRSFSNDSEVVAACGPAFITAQQAGNTIATAKHFPGLGAASAYENTDLRPVTINLSKKVLRDVDMAPYMPAIAAGVDMVMASWAVYPALDPDFPSGMSRKIIHSELRGRLGFRGVTCTDALEAGSLVAFGDAGERGLHAARAGMDMLLASQRNVTQGEAIHEALVGALESGGLARGQFEKATERIMELRRSLLE